MNIRHVNKENNYVACTGDLLITEDMNGVEWHLLFCENTESGDFDQEGYSTFYLVDVEDGYMFKQALHKDDEIKIGFCTSVKGLVKAIIQSSDIELLVTKS